MKSMKKILSLVMALAIVLSMGVGALAVDITIDDDTIGTYYGYRLLTLTTSLKAGTEQPYDKDDYNYAYTVNSKYVGVLKSVTGLNDEKKIVSYISTLSTAGTREFADEVYKAIVEVDIEKDAESVSNKFDVSQGYWLIADLTGNRVKDDANSLVMLDTAGQNTITIDPKKTLPTVEKDVYEESTNKYGKEADYDINDSVPFRLTAYVPVEWLASYEGYKIVFHDTLSEGLTFDEESVVVSINNTETTAYSLDPNPDNNESFTITVDNIETYIDTALAKTEGDTTEYVVVVVEYNAILNESAVVYSESNPNEVYLEYTSNAYDDRFGKTNEVEVDVYTYKFNIFKYTLVKDTETYTDGKYPLSAAEFELYTSDTLTNDTKINFSLGSDSVYRVNPNGTDVLTSNISGMINIEGLDKGTYYLVETKAPDGYNKIDTPKTVVIAEGNIEASIPSTLGGQTVEVENNSGAILPSTGGIGTTIFYVIGSALVLLAIVLIVVKNKKNKVYED